MAFKIELGPSSATAIELPVEYSSNHGKKQLGSKHRTLDGSLFVYTWSNYIRRSYKVDYISLVNASIINSWWETNAQLLLLVTSDTVTDVFSVMIISNDEPMSRFTKPSNVYKSGTIQLEGY